MNAYLFTLRHDSGTVRVQVIASRVSVAVRTILERELAPFRAIAAIKRCGPVIVETPTTATLKERGERLDRACANASATLRAIPGVGTGPISLTPDSVKAGPDYIAARRAYREAFSALRAFNASLTKEQQRALANERRKERAALAAQGGAPCS